MAFLSAKRSLYTVAVIVFLCQEKVEVLNKVGDVLMMQVGWIYDTMKVRLFGCNSGICTVMSLPQRKVIRHVVERCALEWYRLGIELGYEDGEIQDMTVGIPTPQGKLQVIIERKANEHGKKKAVEALLDACDQIIPLATVAVMEDLGLKYTGTGKILPICCESVWHSV